MSKEISEALAYGRGIGFRYPTDPVAVLARAYTDAEKWHEAALQLGEWLATVGPDGYYSMTPEEWLAWAKTAITVKSPGVGMTKCKKCGLWIAPIAAHECDSDKSGASE